MNIKPILYTLLTGVITLFSAQAFAQTTMNEQELKLEKDSIREKLLTEKSHLNGTADLKQIIKSEAKLAKATKKEAERTEDEIFDTNRQASKTEAKVQRRQHDADKQLKSKNSSKDGRKY